MASHLTSAKAALTVLLVLISGFSLAHLPTSSGQFSAGSSCNSAVATNLSNPEAFNSPKAIELAQNSSQLEAVTSRGVAMFYSIFHLSQMSVSAGSCTLVLESVNVVFTLSNGSLAIVSENPNSTKVLGLSLQTPPKDFAASNWAGYEYNQASTNVVKAVWTQPTVTSAQANNCPVTNCAVGFWVGEAAQSGGANGVDQTGTAIDVSCGIFGCSVSGNYAWYEYYGGTNGGPPVTCFSTSSGDSILAGVQYSGGYNTWTIQDSTNGQVCNGGKPMSMGQPYYSEFMAEDGCSYPGCATDFGSMTFSSATIGSTGIYSLSPYQQYTSWYMSAGSVTSSNSFTVTYT